MRRIIPIFLFLAVLTFIIFSSPICLAEGGDLDEYMSYYVQVPAQLKPGETGTVSATGMWGTNEILKVTTADTITLSYKDQTLVLSVHFDGINSIGKGGTQMLIERLISIEDKEVMFGEWVGHITYNVELYEKQADCENDIHVDANGDGNCDSCGKTFITIDGVGDFTVSEPNVEILPSTNNNIIMAARPPVKNDLYTMPPVESQEPDELIEFEYGIFESRSIYNPGEYETVEYTETITALKRPAPYWTTIATQWVMSAGYNPKLETPDEFLLSSLPKQPTEYIVYAFEFQNPLTLNGVEGADIKVSRVQEATDDSLENAIYLAAYINKIQSLNTHHVAKWDGSQYVDCGVDENISNVQFTTETYTYTTRKQVVTKLPSNSTEYTYIPQGILKASTDMTWKDWLCSEHNTIAPTDAVVRNSNYEIVSHLDTIVAGESYSFQDAIPVDYYGLAPGLYKSGSNYTEMVMDWATLVSEGMIIANDYAIWHECSDATNCRLAGDLVVARDTTAIAFGEGTITMGFAQNHKSLTGVIIPNGITTICQTAFLGCTNLSKIVIPDGVNRIEGMAFSGCGAESLGPLGSGADIEFPGTVKSIGVTALSGSDLKYIEFPSGVEIIESNSTGFLPSLETVILPNTLTTIERGAFSNSQIKTITIPSSVTRIGSGVFSNCKNLSSINFEGEHTWYYTESADYTGGTQIDLSDAELAAQYFVGEYVSYRFYNENDGGGGEDDPCVTSDTLVTLADGTKKRIDSITINDKLLVWDSFNGTFVESPAAIIFNHGSSSNTIIELKFSDDTTVKVVNLHQFIDLTENKYVSINKDTVQKYVGHSFAKRDGDSYSVVQLVDYSVREEVCEAWGIISSHHYNILVEDMISTDFMLEDYGLFNYFEFGDGLKYDSDKMQADVEKYGLYTYDEFAEYLTEAQFDSFNIQYMKVAVGKGQATKAQIIELIKKYLLV